MTNDVVKRVNSVPVISAEAMAHVDRYAKGITLACFEMNGGLQSFADWAKANESEFYVKLWGKLIGKSVQVEHSGTITIDDAITRLESQTVDADYVVVEQEYDL